MNMDFTKKYSILSLLLILLLAGCCRILPVRKAVPYRVITQIWVVYENGELSDQRQVFQEAQMRPILDCLRHLDPYGRPQEDPEEVAGNDFRITLYYSDGTQRVYHQHSDRYLRIDDGPWRCVDQAKAMELKLLLWMLPGDPCPTDIEPIPPLICPKI